MVGLSYMFAKPKYISSYYDEEHPITIHPVKLKDYDEFQECSSLLYLSRNHFEENPHPLLALVFVSHEQLGLELPELIARFTKLFYIVTQQSVQFITGETEGFLLEDGNIISADNYDEVREIIMHQNLMFEQRIYKTKRMNEWAQKALLAKQKGAPKISMEDIVSTVSAGCHKHYWDLENYTIYQLYSDFYRFRKIENHKASIQYRCAGADLDVEDYAEDLDLFHNPYDDLFVSADKLSGLNKAVK